MAFGDDLFGTDPNAVVDTLLQQQAPQEATGSPVNKDLLVDRLTRKMMAPPAPAPTPEPGPSRVRTPAIAKPAAQPELDFSDMGAGQGGDGPDFSDMAETPQQPRYDAGKSGLQGYEPPKAAKSRTWGETFSDLAKNWSIGQDTVVQNARELVDRIPSVGKDIGKKLDDIDRAFNMPVGKELEEQKKRTEASLSPQIKESSRKLWWDDKSDKTRFGWFGDAWTDPLAYESTITQSMPEQVITMLPSTRLAKWAYELKVAAGATVEAASKTAARTALISGSIAEGLFGGAASSREVRDTINELPEDVLQQSEAYQTLLQSGMSPKDARSALADDKATMAFMLSGTVTGMFGGMGDRAVAKILTERLTKKGVLSTVKSGVGGALGEGAFEEFPQSAGQKLAENAAKQGANPNQNLSEGVLNEAFGGLAAGGVQGGAMGAGSHLARGNTAPPAPAPAPAGGPAGTGPTPGAGPQPGGSPGVAQGQNTGTAPPPPQSTPGEIDDFLQQTGGQPVDRRPDDVRRGAQTRQEIDDFLAAKGAGQAPTTPQDQAASGPSPNDVQRAVLREAGWMERAIDEMSDGERAQAAQQALDEGVNPDEAVKNHFKPQGSRANPIVAETADDVVRASQLVLPAPSDKQASAENFRHAHLDLPQLGLTGAQNISIETGVGGTRRGTDADGTPWEVQMPAAYGRIKGTKGADGQPLDIYIGPQPTNPMVYVIDQHDPKTGKFDEHKIMAGFAGPVDAMRAYDAAFTGGGRDRIGGVTPLTADQFKAWIASGKTTEALKGAQTDNYAKAVEIVQKDGKASVSYVQRKLQIGYKDARQLVERMERDGVVGPANHAGKREVLKKSAPVADTQRAPGAVESGVQTEAPSAAGEPTQDATDRAHNAPASDNVPTEKQEKSADEFVDDVIATLGEGARDVLPADVMRAAEIMADSGVDAATAFQEAVVDQAVDAGYLTHDEAVNAYGEQVEQVIQPDAAAASERGEDAASEGDERSAAEAEGERAGEAELVPSSSAAGGERTEGDEDTAVEAGGKPDTERGKPDTTGGERDAGSGAGGGRGDVKPAAEDEGVASKRMETAIDEIEEAIEAKDEEAVQRAADRARKVLKETPRAIKDEDREYWSQFGRLISKMEKPGYVTAKQEAEAAKGQDGGGILDDDQSAEDAAYYSSPMQPKLSFEPAQDSTIQHYAKGLGIEIKGKSREQLIEALIEKGARAYQTGGIIAIPRSPAGMVEALQPADRLKDVPDDLFARFKQALASNLDVIKSRADIFETEPTGETWRWKVPVNMGEKEPASLDFTAYGDHVYLTGGYPGKNGRSYGSDMPKPMAARMVRQFIKDMETRKPAEPKPARAKKKKAAAPAPAPVQEKWTKIGTNARGNPLFEDDRGVRSYTERGVRITEPVGVIPGGGISIDRDARGGDYLTEEERKPAEPEDTRTPEEIAAAEAPTWAEILAQLPMHSDGRTRQHEIAFNIMSEITGTKNPAFNDLTPAQKGELLARVKKPAKDDVTDAFDDIFGASDQSPYEITSRDQVDPDRPVVLGTVYRGTEAGNADAKLRVTMNGDLGRGVYVTHLQKLAASYGGGPTASVSKGTRVVHTFNITEPLAPKDVAFAFTDDNSEVEIVRASGETIWQGEWTAGRMKENDTEMGAAIRASGVKAVIGTKGGFLHNQTVILDRSILENADAAKPRTAGERTAGKAAASAAKRTAAGLDAALDGLMHLFGGNKLSSGLSFDEETYAKAKPFFAAAAREFAGAWKDMREFARLLVDALQQKGMAFDALRKMRPYLERFSREVRDGTIDLKESTNEPARTEGDGSQALDEVPAEQGAGASASGDAGGKPARGGQSGAGGNRDAAEGGVSGARGEGGGASEAHPAAAGGQRGRAKPRTGRAGARVSEAPAGAEGRGGADAAGSVGADANIPAVNFRITDEVNLGQGSETVKFNDNIAAIETLKRIEAENRRATPDEQRTLARYVGWGGLANAFRDPEGNVKSDWKARVEQLEGLLTDAELRAARSSTRNAHYTSKTVVDAMWKAAQRLGFKGGLALEMSAGTGNFLGLMPEDVAGATKFVAIEYDSVTARIAKLLYPNETVLHAGLHQVPLPDGEAVLNIGNPPFGSESLRFQYKPEVTGLSIHNQFFVAGLDTLQPGGLQIMVVSRYLMDAQDSKAREVLATKAKLLGAIRLPDTAFKENARTEVVTDILFLQRRTPAEEKTAAENIEKAKKEGFHRVSVAANIAWIATDKVRDPLGGEDMIVNSYFKYEKPMIMGRLERSGTMRQRGEVNVKLEPGADLAAMLDEAITRLPENVLHLNQDIIDRSIARHKTMSESLDIALSGHEVGHVERNADGKLVQVTERETASGGYEPVRREITAASPWSRQLLMDKDGNWYTLEAAVDEKGAKVKAKGKRNVYERKYFAGNEVPGAMRLGPAKFARLSDLVTLRDLVKRQLVLEAQDAKASEMEGNRKKLAAAYRAYVDANGLLNDPANMRIINEMPDGALISSLEFGYREPITATKAARTGEKARPASAQPAPIMSRRVVMKYEAPTSAATPQDALSITLSETGRADIDRIAQLLGKDREETIAALTEGETPLLYKDPETGGYDTANGYLSGNVVRKLKAATEAGLDRNVRALEKVQPERWSAENVTATIGANWIPASTYNDFAKHLFKTSTVTTYSKVTNSFQVVITGKRDPAAMDQWRTDDITPDALINGLLNSRVPKVVREDGEGRRYVDQEASALVAQKAREMENEFSDWVFADTERRNKLVDIYNDKFNTRVNRQHDGSHLTLPGKVPDEVIKLRRHQKNAVWRGIYERFMLLDHVVGAGKTFTAIARAMERRRMGLSRKPAVVVPNHLVDQWAADVYRLYPGAKVLAAGKNQFDRKNRRRLFAKIATGDWDIIIVPHSSFGFIGIAPETETRFLDEELRIAMEAVKEAQEAAAEAGIAGGRKPFNVKEAERLVTTIETRMDGLKKATRDRMLTFEQLGIDDLTVDEAHEFKNLFYSSRLVGVRGMGDKSGSQKAFDLYNKIRVLRESPTGTVTFMTGTPISNSAVEMYTMMRYLAADDLRELGLEHFDAWRTQSVSAASKFEPTEAGGLKEVTRLGRTWSNMRALMELYYSFTDAVSQEDINRWYAEDNNGARFPVPKIKNGGRKEVVVKPTEAQQFILQEVVNGFNGLPSISDPIERNATRLRLMDRARKVSLDARAVDPRIQSTEDDGKLDQIADNVKRIYDATAKDRGTQLVFIDRSVPSSKGDAKKIKEYDDLIAKRDAALADGNERGYREAVEQLDTFDANEIETLRNAAKGGWNAYDQLKRNLVERGVPAEEIRFVQEANSDLEKKALFDAVNDGSIRVMVGSTPRMGAGTNVQERLVALHHGDVTWKPSDIEQREGRIIRQGNKLLEKYGADAFEVEILAYVTERTVDAKMWDLNATKLRMINGIRKYDGSFTMEFDDEDAVGMAEIAALASGDPLLMERVKLMAEIDKMELLERAHRRKMFGIDDVIHALESAKRDYPERLERGKARAAVASAARAAMEETAKGRSVEIEGKPYSFEEYDAARQAILDAIAAQQGEDEKAKYALTIGGQRVTSKEAINAAIADALGDKLSIEATIDGNRLISRTKIAQALAVKANNLFRLGKDATDNVGKLAGYDMALSVTLEDEGKKANLALTLTDNGETIVDREVPIKTDAEPPTITLRSLFDKVEGDLIDISRFTGEWMVNKMREADERLPNLYAQQGKGFEKADELKALRDRLSEVTKILADRTAQDESRVKSAAQPQEDEGILSRAQESAADDYRWSARVLQNRGKIEQLARDFIRAIVGPGVEVRFHEGLIPDDSGTGRAGGWGTIEIAGFKGQYMPLSRIIRLALYGSGESFNGVMFHEAYHHVATWLMPDNVRALMRAEIPRLRRMIQVYKGYTRAEADSLSAAEVEAIAAEAWFRGVQSGVHVGLRRWFASLVNAARRIYNGLRGLGFTTAEDIFGDIKAGKYATAEERVEPSDHPRIDEPLGAIAPSSRRAPLPEEAETVAEMLMARGFGRLAQVANGFGLGRINPTEVRTLLQDKFIRIRNAEKSTGQTLPLSQAAYQAESLYYGRTGQRLEHFEQAMVKPLLKDMRARSVTRDELDQFLYARHAPERNARIASINPALPQDGSGMSDQDAQDILDDIDNAGRRPDFDALERRVRDIVTTTRATLLNYGLISQEMHDAWEDQYDHYVPLRGFNDGIEDVDGPGNLGMGFDTRAREAQRALGRSSEAFSPLAYTLMQAEWAIVRGEKNAVGNTWLRFVQNNPDPDRWEVNRPRLKRVFDERSGLVLNRYDREIYDNEFVTKIGGQPYIITHHGAHGANLARALRNMGSSNVNGLVRFIGMLTRTLARINTQYSPEFMLTNFERDLGEALINMNEQQRAGFKRAFLRHLPHAYIGAFQALSGRGTGPYAQAFREFDRAGGRIRFFGLEDADDVRSRIESTMSRAGSGLMNAGLRGLERANDAWEVVTGANENAVRLAVYMAARELGTPIAESAAIARNMTVNFNRRGEWGQYLSALYAFGNAGIQGIFRMAQALQSRNVGYALGGLVGVAAGLTAYNIGAGGDDDEGKSLYLKVPSHVRDKNLIIMWPKGYGRDGQYLQWRLPIGFAMFYVLGAEMTAVTMGKQTPGKAFDTVLGSVLEAINPFGQDQNKVAMLAPTLVRPAIHVETNQSWTGRPIFPDSRNKDKPDSSQYFKSASDFSVWLADKMNRSTGGDPYRKGWIDVHPGTIDTYLQFMSGGVGRFTMAAAGTADRAVKGEFDATKTPFVRQMVGRVPDYADEVAYREQSRKARDAQSTVNDAIKDRKAGRNVPESERVIRQGAPDASKFRETDRQVKTLRDATDRIKADKGLSEQERKDRITKIESRIRALENQAMRGAR